MKVGTAASILVGLAAGLLARAGASPPDPATATPEPAESPRLTWVFSRPAGVELTRSEVTVAQYRACVAAGKCTAPVTHASHRFCNWGHPDREGDPVNCVVAKEAAEFCAWAGGRLPTEVEWLAEASDGGRRIYPWGDAEASCERAVCGLEGDGCGQGSTWPVCSKPAGHSVSGLCDLAGNVWEWTASAEGAEHAALYGGCWTSQAPDQVRVNSRLSIDRFFWHATSGFRCARSAQAGGEVRPAETPRLSREAPGLMWVASRPAGVEFSRSEVTVAQYRACVAAGRCEQPKTIRDRPHCNWGQDQRDAHPVNCVDWHQATRFCAWVGGRLPTAAEWLAEASDGAKRAYPWGDEEASCARVVWSEGGPQGCGRYSTWPVCSKPAGHSVSGLCDLAGNVWEWTGTAAGEKRVVRGGSWLYDLPGSLRVTLQDEHLPSYWHISSGFRCARGAPQPGR